MKCPRCAEKLRRVTAGQYRKHFVCDECWQAYELRMEQRHGRGRRVDIVRVLEPGRTLKSPLELRRAARWEFLRAVPGRVALWLRQPFGAGA